MRSVLRHRGVLAAAVALSVALAGVAAVDAAAKASTTQGPASTAAKHVSNLTEAQASAQARRSGKSVPVTGDTNAYITVTANPNGTFTQTTSNQPVRARVGATWQDLDATLARTSDGGYAPKLSSNLLEISGGGGGPMARMSHDATSLTLKLPADVPTLPTPSVSGATATYRNVLTGVDLQVTVTDQGGFSEVLVVHDMAAAADPALASLSFPAIATGVHLATSADGGITAADSSGKVYYTAPAPTMWDSATDPAVVARAVTATNNITHAKQALDPRSGDPVYSSSDAAGAGAHTANLKARYANGRITLAPDPSVLHSAKTVYPVYIDPSYGSVDPRQSWTFIRSDFPTETSNFDATDSNDSIYGDLRVGYAQNDVTGVWFNAESMVQMGISESTLHTAQIWSSTLYTTEEWSYSCTATEVDLYQVNAISSGTQWNNFNKWSNPGAWPKKLLPKSLANKYGNSGCAPASVGWDVTGEMTNAITSNWSNVTFGLTTPNENDSSNWHRFATTVTQTTTYNHTPNTPTALHTSPSTQCTTQNPDTVGLGNVTLYAGVSDPDGGTVYAYFKLWNTTTGATVASTNALSQGSGTTATFSVPKSDFNLTSKTEYSWDVYISDGSAGNNQTLTSKTSATCDFYYDPTVPGAPDVTGSGSYQIGQPATFTIAAGTCPSGETNCTPTSYLYQVNTSSPISAPYAGANTAITVKPPTQTFTLTVTAETSGGNLGQPASAIFYAAAPVPAPDKDLNGDSVADLLTTGQTDLAAKTYNEPNNITSSPPTKTGYAPQSDPGSSTPAGLWLDDGNGTTGQLATSAADVGVYGNSLSGNRAAADFTGTESITGNYTTDNFQDVIEYNPVTGTGAVIGGSGDGSPLQTADTGKISNINTSTLADNASEDPLQIANAYASVNNNGFPDLVGINGDDTNGYYLDYYESMAAAGEYGTVVELTSGSGFGASPIPPPNSTLANNTWNTWTIYSAEIGGSTNLILWQPATGLLYDWAGFSYNPTANSGAGALTIANAYELSNNFDTGRTVAELEAASTQNDNLLIYTVTTGGTVNADEFTNLTTSGAATDTPTVTGQPLSTATHAWALNDYNGTAADNTTSGALNLTGAGGVTSHTQDLFSPDIYLNGTSGTTLAASGSAIDLTHSFTVSLWAKPGTYGTMALSQDGTNYPGLMIYPTSSGWEFYLAKDAGTGSWNGDSIIGGTAQLGSWAHIQATYNAGTKVMEMYVDDTLVATGSHTAPATGATKTFRLGSNIDGGQQTSWYTGQLAQVQSWSGGAYSPIQPVTPAAYHQAINPERILDTRQTTNNTLSGALQNDTPVGAHATASLKIVGDTVTPANKTTATTIPANATAAAVDVTVISPTANGNLTVYADGSQVPVTSSTNFATGSTTTGYQVVPIGPDGAIAFYNSASGTAHLAVDITGYYIPDPNHILAADQTYHPLPQAQRILDTRNGTGATQAKLTPGGSINVKITGIDGVPNNAATVAINLTAANQSGGGIIQAYQTGTALNANSDTSLTYTATATASLAADVNLGTGNNAGKITITNTGSSTTDVIGDVQGYFTNDDTGQLYYTVNPTRLVDTRNGIGGTTGAIASNGVYKLSDTGQTDAGQITTTPDPTYALQLTVTAPTANGDLIAYPDPTRPTTSNLNWATNQTIANLALVQPGADHTIDLYNQTSGTSQLVLDTSGYFANDPFAPAHDWQLNDGTGSTAQDTAGNSPLSLNGTYTWPTTNLNPKNGDTVLALDGTSAYATTTGPAVNTTGSFTVSAWADLSSLSISSYATVAAQSGTEASGFYLQYNASWQGWCLNFLQSDTTDTGGLADVPCTSTVPTTGTWYYLVGTYDAASHTAALYVNGALAKSVTGINPWVASGNLTVGAGQYNGSLADFFPGDISNVETYAYALSTAQISETYQQAN